MHHVAYLDGASASMLVSAVVAGAAGIGVFFKTMGRRMSSPFRRKSQSQSQSTDV